MDLFRPHQLETQRLHRPSTKDTDIDVPARDECITQGHSEGNHHAVDVINDYSPK